MTISRATRAPIGIQRRMMELGVIRFGETVQPRDKGRKPYPRALDKFRLTSASRALLEAAAEKYGAVKAVRAWTVEGGAPNPGMFEVYLDTAELPVVLPPTLAADDGSPTYPYSQWWELWSGAICQRRCDGEVCIRPKARSSGLEEVACLCDPDDRECEITTRISVMLPDLPGIGLWRLNTGGKFAAAELPGTLQLLSLAAAQKRYLQCTLRLEPRSSKRRNDKGETETHRYVVPVLDPGITPGELFAISAAPQAVNMPRLGNGEKPALPAGPSVPTESLEKPVGELVAPPALPSVPLVPPNEQPGQEDHGGGATSAIAPAPASTDGDPWMRAIHAIGRERGLDHDAIRAIAAGNLGWPGTPEDWPSLTDLNPLQRGQLRKALEDLPIPQPEEVGAALPQGSPPPVSQPEADEASDGDSPAPASAPAAALSPPEDGSPATSMDDATRAVMDAASKRGITTWERLDALASQATGKPADAMSAGDWTLFGSELAAGVHDELIAAQPQPRSRKAPAVTA